MKCLKTYHHGIVDAHACRHGAARGVDEQLYVLQEMCATLRARDRTLPSFSVCNDSQESFVQLGSSTYAAAYPVGRLRIKEEQLADDGICREIVHLQWKVNENVKCLRGDASSPTSGVQSATLLSCTARYTMHLLLLFTDRRVRRGVLSSPRRPRKRCAAAAADRRGLPPYPASCERAHKTCVMWWKCGLTHSGDARCFSPFYTSDHGSNHNLTFLARTVKNIHSLYGAGTLARDAVSTGQPASSPRGHLGWRLWLSCDDGRRCSPVPRLPCMLRLSERWPAQ